MNYLTITSDYYPSNTGFGQAFYHLHSSILENEKDSNFFVFCSNKNAKSFDERVKIEYFKKMRGERYLFKCGKKISLLYTKLYYSKLIKKIKNVIKENDIKFILIESMYFGTLSKVLNDKLDIPVVTRFHGCSPEFAMFDKNIKYKRVSFDCIFDTKYIASTTQFYFSLFDDYYKSYNLFSNKCFFLIPNPCKRVLIEEDSKKNASIRLFQLGRISKLGYYQKGFDDVISSLLYLESVLDEEDSKKIIYNVVGNGTMKEYMLSRLSKLKYITVNYYESVSNDEVKKILNETDIVLMPSRCEGMSMFAVEAVSQGKAFIFTGNNGLKEILIDGYNGIKVDVFDYIGIANAIIRLKNNSGLLKEFSNNSIGLYESELSYDSVYKKFTVLKKSIVNE